MPMLDGSNPRSNAMTEREFFDAMQEAWNGAMMSNYDPALHVAGTWEGDQRRLRELKHAFVQVCEQRNDAQAERDRLRAAITTVLGLTSSYDADLGNHVLLVSNLQARGILESALEATA